MKAIVVYESVYGNTRDVAQAVADGLGEADVVPVHEAAKRSLDGDLLVVGGPTHMHGLATTRSRRMAVAAVHEDGGPPFVEPGATQEPGLRAWLKDLPRREGAEAAAFDTRLDQAPWLSGVASRGIANRLRRHGYHILATESFLVVDSEGPLNDGELDRARAWGRLLAESMAAASAASAASVASVAGVAGGRAEGA